jgi:hypothetical protein
MLHHVPATAFQFSYKREEVVKRYEDTLLDEHDAVWRNLRYEDFTAVMDSLQSLLDGRRTREAARTAQASASRTASDRGDDMDTLRTLMQVLASDAKEFEGKIGMHIFMRRAIEARFAKRRLHDLISLQQTLVTGVDASGAKASKSDIDSAMRKLLAETTADKSALSERMRKRKEKTDPDGERLKPLLRAV